jgi:two-component system cell cycle sensor histidine kinase/response regulator CckA
MDDATTGQGEWFRLMCEHSPDFMVVLNRERRFVWVNRLHPGVQLSDVIGKPVDIFEHPDTHERSRAATSRAFALGEQQSFESHSVLPDGSELWFYVRCIPIAGHPDHVLLVTSEITERKRAERDRDALQTQLHQSRKMEAIGRLAAGVAHDFNNLLTPIIGYTQMAMQELAENVRAYDALRGVVEAALRAAELTAQLLTIGRGHPPATKPVDVADMVRGMERILRRVVPENVSLSYEGVCSDALVLADRGQLEQVLLNLVINACDAMPSGGRLEIGAQRSDDSVLAWVHDTGTGIEPEVMQRLFEPFFSTKGTHGTGLGLATAHAIVRESGGTIEVVSEVGTGTRFIVKLPACREPLPSEEPAPMEVALARVSDATILVVEDEPAVRALVASLLTDAGYRVLQASSGEEAFALTEGPYQRIDLVVSDVVLPGLSGPQVIARLREKYPSVRVLFMSGHAMNKLRREDLLGARLLRKPFTRPQLLTEVNACLQPGQAPLAGA